MYQPDGIEDYAVNCLVTRKDILSKLVAGVIRTFQHEYRQALVIKVAAGEEDIKAAESAARNLMSRMPEPLTLNNMRTWHLFFESVPLTNDETRIFKSRKALTAMHESAIQIAKYYTYRRVHQTLVTMRFYLKDLKLVDETSPKDKALAATQEGNMLITCLNMMKL